MQIKILGTRGEIVSAHPKHVKHSGILIDHKILLDIGEKKYLNYHPRLIFITHLHPDHAFFMSSVRNVLIPVPVYAPEKTEKLKEVQVVSKPIEFESYVITPIPVIHSTKVKSSGYLIEKNNKRIFYSGDIASINEEYYTNLEKLDLVITEASFLRKGGLIRKNKRGDIFGHAGVPDLVNIFEKLTRHIVFTHFGTWFIKDPLSGMKKIKSMEKEGLKLDVSIDGATYSL